MDLRDSLLPDNIKDQLIEIGYSGPDGVEKLISAAQVAGPEMAAYLDISMPQLSAILNNVAPSAMSVPMSSIQLIQQAVYSLGFAISEATPPSTAPVFPAVPAPVPANVDMTAQMPPVRSQGDRGTCVAHAAIAVYEHHLSTAGALQDLSEQFLYWNCKRYDGIPNVEGTFLSVAFPCLQRDGTCLEPDWPYNPNIIIGNEGHHPPPSGAQVKALSFRPAKIRQLSPTFVADIKAELAIGRCVAFSIPVFNSWYGSKWVAHTGEITMPIPNEIRAGGHAMCLVGYVELPHNPELGFGRFILRNSWGQNWGITSPYGAGYGTIPFAYLAKVGAEAYSLM
jgi:hypothetical protein